MHSTIANDIEKSPKKGAALRKEERIEILERWRENLQSPLLDQTALEELRAWALVKKAEGSRTQTAVFLTFLAAVALCVASIVFDLDRSLVLSFWAGAGTVAVWGAVRADKLLRCFPEANRLAPLQDHARALALVQKYPEAATYCERALAYGRELVELDLDCLEKIVARAELGQTIQKQESARQELYAKCAKGASSHSL